LHLKLADFKHSLDKKYYLSSQEEKIKKNFIKYFQKKRLNEKIFVAKKRMKLLAISLGALKKQAIFRKKKDWEKSFKYS